MGRLAVRDVGMETAMSATRESSVVHEPEEAASPPRRGRGKTAEGGTSATGTAPPGATQVVTHLTVA